MGDVTPLDTRDLWSKDRDHVIHPFSDLAVNREQGCTVIAKGDGAYVFDSEGNRFLDGIGGLWCVNIGYGREEMIEAIADQIRKLPYYSGFTNLTNAPASELAARIAELTPGSLNRIFFGTGGSMATDSAVRIIHHYNIRRGRPAKRQIISREHAYHGSTYLSASLTGPSYQTGFNAIKDFVHHIPAPYTYRRPEGMSTAEFCDAKVDDLENKIVELGPENVAAFIAEPIMGAGGVIVPPPGYHRRTWEVCRQYDVLYIADEVVTAFGRLGHWFASKDVFDTEPDIICSAKGISSGYQPLSATIVSEEIYDVISAPDGAFYHGFTYSGHPVACAAGLRNIEIMEREDLCGTVRQTGPYFEEALQGLADLEIVGDVRGSHFMMCIENVADRESKRLFPADVYVGRRIAQHCQRRGLIVRPLGHLNILSPPLILTHEQIETIAAVLRESIRATQDDLVKEGLWN
jgi:putrescine aminotransferase